MPRTTGRYGSIPPFDWIMPTLARCKEQYDCKEESDYMEFYVKYVVKNVSHKTERRCLETGNSQSPTSLPIFLLSCLRITNGMGERDRNDILSILNLY